MSANPFLDSSFQIRWSALTPDAVASAIEAALAGAEVAVEAIASRDPAAATYENTLLALEKATEELTLAWGKVTHLQSVADSPALREAHNAMLPKVSSFYARIPLNAALWQRIKAVAESPAAAKLTGIHRRFLDETVADFRQAGADLPPEKKARLEALQSELAQITQKYSENVLDSTNGWQLIVEDENRLAGLPVHAKAAARRNAEAKSLGGWRFTLHMPSQEPFMTYLEDDALRREMWTAAIAVGAQSPHDNTALIGRILALRAEKAALLGKDHFADLVLERRMAKSGARALRFLEELKALATAPFARECRELEEFKAQRTGGAVARLAPWEIGFWAEKLRQERYNFDEEILRPYFPMNRVIEGLFELSRRIFGLQIVERGSGDAEVWHPEVKFYDLRNEAGVHLGSFYADWHPRESKRGGAWMNYLITGGPRPGDSSTAVARAPHLGLICGNMTPPVDGRAALLTHREVETIFHEFGHLLHHLLGEVEIKSLNGVNVAWDFVELPSQIMENWCWERESLDLFARHHETGAPIPPEIFAKMIAAKNFRSAAITMRQLAFAKMDLLLHMRTAEFAGEADIEPKARALIAECLVPTQPPAPTIVKRFTHLFSDPVGYAAGYYSYKWAEVLDADAFTRFKREGIFNRSVGAEFVEKILSRGNSADAAELYRAFMGREPDLNALLRRSGLVTVA
ncbi:MAG TPA: M3 family metallopeptidase [Opitutaceae bacterium]|nr:M3 family metallopeptidase [Opitutaceae bacterium]